MKKRLLLFVVMTILLAGVFLFYSFRNKKELVNNLVSEGQTQTDNLHVALHMDKEFYGDLNKIIPGNVSDEKIYGGIVSHHFLVAKEIAKFFSTFKKQPPKVIVIVGPNHFNVGNGDILVSDYPYKTPWGIVYPEKNYIEELLNKKVVYQDEDPFSREHSISALVGLIKYYLPETKIIPIIVKRGVSVEKVEILAQSLNEILPENSVVISSVDFSHHLNKVASQFHDERSISAIKSFDFGRILNSEIDSPASIYTVLRYLELRGAQKMIYKNVNSADFTGNIFLDDVTSYLFAHFVYGNTQTDGKVSVLSFGDMMFARDVENSIKNGTNPFEKIIGTEGNFLRGVDFISANLEGPITENKDCAKKAYSFKFSPSTTNLIVKSGINIVNLANNHTSDCKEKGMIDTENYLSKKSIDFFGNPSIKNSYIEKEIDGKKIVFIGINATIHSDNLAQYYELIKKLKEKNDYLVVNIHWGYEYHDNPSQIQKEIAHSLVNNGADLIIGHHPHIIQPMEIYKNKVIFYSLGNFIFDQIGKKTNKGFGIGTVFNKENVKFYLFPYDIKKYQPTLLPSQQARNFCNEYLSGMPNASGCYFEIKAS